MYPEILHLGPFVISSFGLMLVIAFLSGNYLLRRDMEIYGQDPIMADDLTFRAAIGGILGAKLYYIIENIPSGHGLDNLSGLAEIFSGLFTLDFARAAAGIQNFGSGMVFYGGLIGGTIAITLYIRKHGLRWLETGDWVAPYLALGHSVGRIGCFLVGDDYGVPSNLPWALSFPNGLPPTHLAVHPTQLYESAAYGIIFFILYKNRAKIMVKGSAFFKYLLYVGCVRFLVEFIRTNPKILIGLSSAQFISIFMIGIGGWFLYSLKKPNKLPTE